MAWFGVKSAHEPVQMRIQDYLERGGRALGHDFLNVPKHLQGAWGYAMDKTRMLAGNDDAVGGGRSTVTYQHFVLSPNPDDRVDLETLRGLAVEWAETFFGRGEEPGLLGCYEVAIVYHDDNTLHIPHAHVIVNNTNLTNGLRLHLSNEDNSNTLPNALQDIARRKGLSFFDNSNPESNPVGKPGRYYTKEERRLIRRGAFSWKEDLRNKIDIAKNLSESILQFEETLQRLEVGWALDAEGEYAFSHPSNADRWKCGSLKLGKAYRRESIVEAIGNAAARKLPRDPALSDNVVDYVMHDYFPDMKYVALVSHSTTAKDAAHALNMVNKYNLRSVGDFKKKIAALSRSVKGVSPELAANAEREIEDLQSALATVESASFFDGVDLARSRVPSASGAGKGGGGGRRGKGGSGKGSGSGMRRTPSRMDGDYDAPKAPKYSGRGGRSSQRGRR